MFFCKFLNRFQRESRKNISLLKKVLFEHTIGYHRNYSGRWLVASMSGSKSTSLMCDFTSLPEFDLMFMSAAKSYFALLMLPVLI